MCAHPRSGRRRLCAAAPPRPRTATLPRSPTPRAPGRGSRRSASVVSCLAVTTGTDETATLWTSLTSQPQRRSIPATPTPPCCPGQWTVLPVQMLLVLYLLLKYIYDANVTFSRFRTIIKDKIKFVLELPLDMYTQSKNILVYIKSRNSINLSTIDIHISPRL